MDIVKGSGLVFEYLVRNDLGEVEDTFKALDNVNIEVKKGEFIAILGHNGSGKSTLAKHINALLLPNKGTLWIRGMNTREEKNLWDVRQSAGMVFQNPDNQIIATIVEEDVAFGPENLGVAPTKIRRRVDSSLEAVGMSEYVKHSPNKLSGGQKQRIAIAGVLAMKPDIIVLDEPTAMLDPSGRIEVIDTILELNKQEGITIILITHFMEEAVKADRVIVMEDGKVIMNDIPRKIFSNVETMKSIGLDVPQVTEVAYMLKKDKITIDGTILTIKEMVDAICQLKSKT